MCVPVYISLDIDTKTGLEDLIEVNRHKEKESVLIVYHNWKVRWGKILLCLLTRFGIKRLVSVKTV